MQPCLLVSSSQRLSGIADHIGRLACGQYFRLHLGLSQGQQKVIVGQFQDALLDHLRSGFGQFQWSKEHAPSHNHDDAIDIFGTDGASIIAIEIDKPRADQVAKKFLSRMALLHPLGKPIYYLAVCYPGTEKMSQPECLKYFSYCQILANELGHEYGGFIIQA